MTDALLYPRLLRDVAQSLTSDNFGTVGDIVLPLLKEAFSAADVTLVGFRSPTTLHLIAAVGVGDKPGPEAAGPDFHVDVQVPMSEAARTGQAVWIEDMPGASDRYPEWPADSPALSVCAVPVAAAGRLVGVLGLSFRDARTFDTAERDVLVAVSGIVGASCMLDRQRAGRRLGIVDADRSREDVNVAHLVRSVDSSVPRTVGTVAAQGAPALSWLLEAPHDTTVETACEGVLALARRRGHAPGVAARAVADLTEELGVLASGVVLQVGPDAGWIAVAGVNACVVLTSPSDAGPAASTFIGASTAADEHVVMPAGDGATVLALLLYSQTPSPGTDRVVDIAREELRRPREAATAEVLLLRVSERLGEHGVDSELLGAMALVVAPQPRAASVHRSLPARPLAAPLGRRFAVAALGVDPDPELAFRVATTVDELVTNSIRHCEETVQLTITVGDAFVRLEVEDDDDRPPPALTADPTSDPDALRESGRGLTLVSALADRWGVTPRPAGGKTVWAELSCGGTRG